MKNSLIIILFDHPLEHTTDYCSQTAKILSKTNIVIGLLLKDALSVKEIILSHRNNTFWHKINSNYYLFTPLYIIPFRRYRAVVNINLFINMMFIKLNIFIINLKSKIQNKYVWIFNPDSYDCLQMFGPEFTSIYDCVDFHRNEDVQNIERKLIEQSVFMFVNSHALYDLHKAVRSDLHLVPQGFDLESFHHYENVIAIKLPQKKPMIGYVGGINSRLDFSLLIGVIKQHPQYNFVFIGPIQRHETKQIYEKFILPKIDTLLRFSNVYHYKYLDRKYISAAIRQFNVAMVPYDSTQKFNAFCYPMKIFEYFFMGKPVISTRIKELQRFSIYIRMGNSIREWSKLIKELISNPWPKVYKNQQQKIAINNSWDHKIIAILEVVDSKN